MKYTPSAWIYSSGSFPSSSFLASNPLTSEINYRQQLLGTIFIFFFKD